MSGWGAEHHLLRVPSSSNREERALTVAMDAVERVRKLHRPCTEVPVEEGGCKPGECDSPCCTACDAVDWPCATIRALDGDSDG